MRRIVIDRLSNLGEHRVNAHCPACGRVVPVDAAALLASVGDILLRDLPGRLRCRCGQRPCEITLHGPEGWDGRRTTLS